MRELKGALKLTVLEGTEKFYPHKTKPGLGMVIDTKIKGSLRPISGYLASEIAEEQARELCPLLVEANAITLVRGFKHLIAQQLKENGLELRVGERPEPDIDDPMDKYIFNLRLQAYDKAMPLNQIIVQI